MPTNDKQSPTHRRMIGDKVVYRDGGTPDAPIWPPHELVGEITGFANEECSYITVDFGDGDARTLTEDDVERAQL